MVGDLRQWAITPTRLVDERGIGFELKARRRSQGGTMSRRRNAEIGLEGRSGTKGVGVTAHSMPCGS